MSILLLMPIKSHPLQGCIVRLDYSVGFKEPEMVKPRLARHGLLTVVALSTTTPKPKMPYHCEIDIPFDLPKYWGQVRRWVKGDMINAVGFHRVDLLSLGKDRSGARVYQETCLPPETMATIRRCVLHGLGLSSLTKHL